LKREDDGSSSTALLIFFKCIRQRAPSQLTARGCWGWDDDAGDGGTLQHWWAHSSLLAHVWLQHRRRFATYVHNYKLKQSYRRADPCHWACTHTACSYSRLTVHVTLMFDLLTPGSMHAGQAPATVYTSSDFVVDCSSSFTFRARTHARTPHTYKTQTKVNIEAMLVLEILILTDSHGKGLCDNWQNFPTHFHYSASLLRPLLLISKHLWSCFNDASLLAYCHSLTTVSQASVLCIYPNMDINNVLNLYLFSLGFTCFKVFDILNVFFYFFFY